VIVLDASALIALIKDEPGADVVSREAANNNATISSVNYAECLQKAARVGVTAEQVDAALEGLASP
jgi:PIN domain nuclease of toxin-antitoxin system